MTAACIHCGNLGPNDDAGGGVAFVPAEYLIDLVTTRDTVTSEEVRAEMLEQIARDIRLLVSDHDAAVRRLDALTLPGAERRERIAKDVLAGFPLRVHAGAFPQENREWSHAEYARHAIKRADALIAALDAKAVGP